MNAWRVSEVDTEGEPVTPNPSPLVGEGGSGAQRRGRVRGNADGLTKRQLLPALTPMRSRELRRNRTAAEDRLWKALGEAFPSARFRFQVPFGPFHADFCSHGAKLVIEVDGGQHDEQAEADATRTRFLNREEYQVIRFWNNDVLENVEGVIATIAPLLPSPPVGEGGAKRRIRESEE